MKAHATPMSEAGVKVAATIDLARREVFERVYHKWLLARARFSDPSNDHADDVMAKLADEVDEAAKQLIATPTFGAWMFWCKWELLEHTLMEDLAGSEWVDRRGAVALGCIKADLMRLLGENPEE